MAVRVSKSGGIYIEISGDYSKLQADLKEAGVIGKAMGKEISDALSGAMSPQAASRSANNLTKYLATAQRSAQALTADLSGNDKQFRAMGQAIGLAGSKLDNYVKLQRQMYQTQAQKAYLDNLKGIQRLTGSTDAEMNQLARSLGGVGDEFSKASSEVKGFSQDVDSATRSSQTFSSAVKGMAALAAGYVSLRGVGNFIGRGLSANTDLQDAQTAIAATLTYTQKLVDEQGRLLQEQEAYNAALRVSEDIAKAIDTATVVASADYATLLSAFQSTLGPAAQVKATWQESLGLLTLMSNAMQVLNVDMERLDKEMLSFMTGRDFSNSQVARNLGISAETVKQWREGGKFVQEMTAALDKFKYAGEQSANSFKAVSRDLSSTVESLAGDMTKGLLERVTASMKDLSRAFYTLENDGGKAVYALRSEMVPLVTLGDDIATAFGDTARSAVRSLVETLEGASAIIADNRGLIDGVGKGLQFLVFNIKPLIAAYAAWKVASSAVNGSIGYQIALMRGSVVQIGVTQTALKGLTSIAASARAGIGGVITAMGGPWVLGITAAAGAVAYLASQESAATVFARQHADAMQMVSTNADTAKQAIDEYAKKLREMNEAQRAFEQARIQRERADITSGGSAYRTIINDITPLAAFDSRATEIRQKLSDAAQLVLPSNIMAASVQDLETLRDRVTAIATEYGRTKEAADALETIDSLIVLARQADIASQSVSNVAGSVQQVANALNSLDPTKMAQGIRELEDKVAQARRSAVGQASATALISIGVDTSDIDKFGNVSQEAFAKYDEATQSSIRRTQELARELHGLNTAARTSRTAASSALSENRAVKYAEDAYLKARDAAEQLRLKNIELAESLRGDTLAASLAKIGRQYQAQVDAIEKDTRDLLAKQEEWRKRGLLTSEVQAFIEQYKEQNQIRLQALEIERQYNEEVARRANIESALGFQISETERLKDKVDALTEAYNKGHLSLEQYNLRLRDAGLELAKLHQEQGLSTWTEDLDLALAHITESYEGVAAGLSETFGDFFSNFTQGFADSVGRAVVDSENLGEAMHNVAKSAISALISGLIQLGLQWAMMQMGMVTVSAAAQQANAAATTAANAEILASAAPAAAAESVATFGGAAVAGAAALALAMGMMIGVMMKGFKTGGYTGSVGKDEVAGVVHGGEYVFDADSVRRIGLNQLEALQHGSVGSQPSAGKAPAALYPSSVPDGGYEERLLRVIIEDKATGEVHDLGYITHDEAVVIARNEARQVTKDYAPKVIASDIGNPNSAVSKSLGKNTKAERRR